jgi:hypothetical protein
MVTLAPYALAIPGTAKAAPPAAAVAAPEINLRRSIEVMEHTPAAWKTKGSPTAQMATGHKPSLAKGVPAEILF